MIPLFRSSPAVFLPPFHLVPKAPNFLPPHSSLSPPTGSVLVAPSLSGHSFFPPFFPRNFLLIFSFSQHFRSAFNGLVLPAGFFHPLPHASTFFFLFPSLKQGPSLASPSFPTRCCCYLFVPPSPKSSFVPGWRFPPHNLSFLAPLTGLPPSGPSTATPNKLIPETRFFSPQAAAPHHFEPQLRLRCFHSGATTPEPLPFTPQPDPSLH